MPGRVPAIEACTIVLLGSFNPGIFHPAWLAAQELIPQPEADSSQNMVVTGDIARFDTDWLSVEVVSERLTLATQKSPYVSPLRDLAESVLNLLIHTPVDAIGINRSAHFPLDNEDVWHSFGHRLAPKEEVWSSILRAPGTRRLTIEGQRDDGRTGAINVTVEPSLRVEYGVFLDINDHFQRPQEVERTNSASWGAEILDKEWKQHQERVERIQKALIAYATQGGEGA